MNKYNHKGVEAKWQKKWDEEGLYKWQAKDEKLKAKDKFYTLVELPYPSGDLHIGHWFTFAVPDVLSRFKRMQGKEVFFPMGFDAFGLPAENAAIKRGIHPKDWTMSNIASMTKQFQTMGTMIDWSRVTITCLPEYYTWNQWIFLKMFEKGIAYRGKTLSNWCPVDQTVLANEHVENGRCWRCGAVVEQKEVAQWFLKITDYADQLEWKKDGNGVDWPKSVQVAQNEWIGKKEGMKITHHVIDTDLEFQTFTAYPAWSWADSYIVIAPEHPLVKELVKDTKHEKDVLAFVDEMGRQTELERKETTEKKGIFTGRYAKDPFGGPDMPIWLANFALLNFGTGIIRCSGHDERDIAFAQKYDIPTREVVGKRPSGAAATPHDGKGGILHNSGPFTGKDVNGVRIAVMDWIEEQEIGKRYINYHLHDWSVSRQRYWGTPVPMVHCKKCGIVPVPEDQLPVELPYDVDYTPKGKPPLASNDEWLATTCPKCQGPATRDAETLDTFFDSSWYYYRYTDPTYAQGPFKKDLVKELMPVDIYFGGGEHTLGHTLYARFFTKFFKDLGLVAFDEFASKRVQHGIVLGPDGNKMSKSKGNVINPDDIVKEFGADAVRVYLVFMMPYEATGPWDTSAMYGMYRFLKRVWELQDRVKNQELRIKNHEENKKSASTLNHERSNSELSADDAYFMHKTIKKVTDDISMIHLNTAVAALMEWLNYLSKKETIQMEEYQTFIQLLAPFAPFITEEIWQTFIMSAKDIHVTSSVHKQQWPVYKEALLHQSSLIIAVQLNGKTRGTVTIQNAKSKIQNDVEEVVKKDTKLGKYFDGVVVKKVIFVPGKIINFVI